MKIYKSALLAVFFCFLFSCHGDRYDEAKSIQYRITADDLILKKVAYRSADGSIITIDNLDVQQLWHITEFVDDKFHAHLKATFMNSADDQKSYKLWCFVEGKIVVVKEGILPAMTQNTIEINYSL